MKGCTSSLDSPKMRLVSSLVPTDRKELLCAPVMRSARMQARGVSMALPTEQSRYFMSYLDPWGAHTESQADTMTGITVSTSWSLHTRGVRMRVRGSMFSRRTAMFAPIMTMTLQAVIVSYLD